MANLTRWGKKLLVSQCRNYYYSFSFIAMRWPIKLTKYYNNRRKFYNRVTNLCMNIWSCPERRQVMRFYFAYVSNVCMHANFMHVFFLARVFHTMSCFISFHKMSETWWELDCIKSREEVKPKQSQTTRGEREKKCIKFNEPRNLGRMQTFG